jgi:hypothetical protein
MSGDYDHFGDPDFYLHNAGTIQEQGFVLIPLEGQGGANDDGETGALIVLEAPSLELVAYGVIPTKIGLGNVDDREHAPLVVVDDSGYVYVSQGKSNKKNETLRPKLLRKLAVDWDRMQQRVGLCESGVCAGTESTACSTDAECTGFVPFLEHWDVLLEGPARGGTACRIEIVRDPMTGEPFALCFPVDGAPTHAPGQIVPLGFFFPQGADMSDDGRLLYMINGSGAEECEYSLLQDPNDFANFTRHDGCGIHVFETTLAGTLDACSAGPGPCVARRIEQSRNGNGSFNYQYNPGLISNREEPEGLTYWDLDAPDAPFVPGTTSTGLPVGGKVHAMLLQIEGLFREDDIYIKHYRSDVACDGVPPDRPGISLVEAIDFGDVPLGAFGTNSLAVGNQGNTDLTVASISLTADSDPGFGVSGFPAFPFVLSPGSAAGTSIFFTPVAEGPALATVEVVSDDPEQPIAPVALGGTGIGLVDQVDALIVGSENSITEGSLSGAGPGASSTGRLGALLRMLESARDAVNSDAIEEACEQLLAAANRSDGLPRPPDFAAGPAAAELHEEIVAVRTRLPCP